MNESKPLLKKSKNLPKRDKGNIVVFGVFYHVEGRCHGCQKAQKHLKKVLQMFCKGLLQTSEGLLLAVFCFLYAKNNITVEKKQPTSSNNNGKRLQY